MNWTKIILAGIAAGVVTWLTSFVMHGLMLGETYTRYEVFSQEETSPLWFLVVGICITLAAAILYAKTHACWGAGWKAGATFGFFLALAVVFYNFYNPLVLEGFPYYLSWCWSGINVINGVIAGAVIGVIYKP